MAAYSGTPLVKKLGIKTGFRMYVTGSPASYFDWVSPLPEGVVVSKTLSGVFDFAHVFVKDQKSFRAILMKAKTQMKSDGMVWVSWPKRSSGVVTDLDENIIRDFALDNGLVDVKVCAVDETWSGLKLVIPVKLRK